MGSRWVLWWAMGSALLACTGSDGTADKNDDDGVESGDTGAVESGDTGDTDTKTTGTGDTGEVPSVDSDGDGLTDAQEGSLGTNPAVPDTDEDGLSDGAEVDEHGSDPLARDTDGDGLTDGQEVDGVGSDPSNPDTDGDGLGDGEELFFGSDVNNADTDGDGLRDGDEVNVHFTDPTKTDTDGDTLSDSDEISIHKTDPTRADTDDDELTDDQELFVWKTDPLDPDFDGDGASDGVEVLFGSDPKVPDTDKGGALDGIEIALGNDPRDPTDDDDILDNDEDGLTNSDEVARGLDPNNPDTDGDGLDDGVEVNVEGTDPLKVDTDGDTLSDGLEVTKLGTDPLKVDTDGGSATDDMEVNGGTDPLDPTDDLKLFDSDDDGLTDFDELFVHGSNPNVVDTDGDTLPDGDEVNLHGTDPTLVDTDGGGINDNIELDDGFDPTDPADDPFQRDTDRDGITDGDEGILGTDLNDADSDNDGLIDGNEVNNYLTDPLDPDSDGGGLDDFLEVLNELDPNDATDDGGAAGLTLIFDDFEQGFQNTRRWDFQNAGVSYDGDNAARGVFALEIGGGGLGETVTVDTSTCSELLFAADIKNGPTAPDRFEDLKLSYFDGSEYVEFSRRIGFGLEDAYQREIVLIDDAAAMNSSFSVEVTNLADPGDTDDFYVDDLRVVCAPDLTDTDGDGVANWDDCDDDDADHWYDCGLCADFDKDGYGLNCDLGPDCDDENSLAYPGNTDSLGDGVDADCNTADGPGLFDDFEEPRGPSAAVWAFEQGPVFGTDADSVSGDWSLQLDGGSSIETLNVDMTACDTIKYSVQIDEVSAGTGDVMHVEYWNGSDWIALQRLFGEDAIPFSEFTGNIPDADALRSDFAMRLINYGTSTDTFRVDDFFVGCGGVDSDGDLYDEEFDCDDGEANLFLNCTGCTDGDGDGYGVGCDRGPDCDDGEANTYPGAPDTLGDGIDQDCNFRDGPGWYDDFEVGVFSPIVWGRSAGPVEENTSSSVSGVASLTLDGQGLLTTNPFDTTSCPTIQYELQVGDDGVEAGDDLLIEYYNGVTWVVVDRAVDGDAIWTEISGSIPNDPAAFRTDFRMRLRNVSSLTSGDEWVVDDFGVGCGGADGDGDGVPASSDCDDTDADLWASCTTCVDGDGDGRGVGCDLGVDCDDGDGTVFPGAADARGDTVDSDCNGFDDPGLFDDFEQGELASNLWATSAGSASIGSSETAEGSEFSLNIDGGGSIETVAVDMSTCSEVLWYFDGKRGPSTPEWLDDLVISYYDGTSFVEADRYRGISLDDLEFGLVFGTISDSDALRNDFRMRLEHSGTTTGDDFHVDNFGITCADADVDGDGFPPQLDCDDTDANLWSACLTCLDADGDGYGRECDLPEDCNDDDAAIFPGASGDTVGDGVDQNCDFADGDALLFEDFEQGRANPSLWDQIQGNVIVVNDVVANGMWSAEIDGGTVGTTQGVLGSIEIDASTCTEVVYSLTSKLGDLTSAKPSANLSLQYDDGTGFVEFDAIVAQDAVTPFVRRLGLLPAAAKVSDLRVQIVNESTSTSDEFHIDDFSVGCSGADTDNDGFPSALDCDDSNADLWASCGRCVDVDGDGYGLDCDRGADCDDGNASAFPGATDSVGNGIDEDCSGADGPGVRDGFELAGPDPVAWELTSIVEPIYYATEASSGRFSLELDGGASIETVEIDTSSCTDVAYTIKVQDVGLDTTDTLDIEYWDGSAWMVAASGVNDDDFEQYAAIIDDAGAKNSAFKMRVVNTGTTSTSSSNDAARIDEFAAGCGGVDGDSDGFPALIDCDDADPDLWFSCETCIDGDSDGYGLECDLGNDCNDGDGSINPAAADSAGNGIDEDCSGVDGPGYFDDFEDGLPAALWSTLDGDFSYDEDEVFAGTFSLRLSGEVEAITIVNDMSGCSQIDWEFQSQRGPEAPENGEDVTLEWWDATNDVWVNAFTLQGDGTSDASFTLQSGSITSSDALSTEFQLRILTDMGSTTSDEVFIDDFEVTCVP